jgi:hypothetical protein
MVAILRADKGAEYRSRNRSRRDSRNQMPDGPVSKRNRDLHNNGADRSGKRLLRCPHLRCPVTSTTTRWRRQSGSTTGISYAERVQDEIGNSQEQIDRNAVIAENAVNSVRDAHGSAAKYECLEPKRKTFFETSRASSG